jgi:mRNA deadenylase 3'-5' endonuclease subunit Ccr4
MRVATYNILANAYLRPERYPRVDPAAFDWSRRREALVARLLGFDADVICLQEVERDAYASMASALRDGGYAGVHACRRGNPDGCATFVRAPRWTMADRRTHYYADQIDGAEASGHLALIVRARCAGRELAIVNTHLRWDAPSRSGMQHVGVRQAALLRDSVLAPGPGWLLCGDFNATPDSEVLAVLADHGLRDAGRVMGHPTFNATGTARRIDFILHTPELRVTVEPAPAIDDATPLPAPGEPSDHLPVVAQVAW